MSDLFSRRDLLKGIGFASAYALASVRKTTAGVRIGQRSVEIAIAQVSQCTIRVSLLARENERAIPIPDDGSLIRDLSAKPVARFQRLTRSEKIHCGDLDVTLSPEPLAITIQGSDGRQIQRLLIDESRGSISFRTGGGPLLGLGEGGPQFDRRGSSDVMRSGQGGYKLRTHGGRVPVQWVIGTEGWAIFIHQPYGSFDLRNNDEGRFEPAPGKAPLPIDLFVVASRDPSQIMKEYAGITGHPEMPPLWSLGYQQSHRTLAGRDEVVSVARTFREKKLPCDALIYLGTGFTPSGWNTANGSFSFNPAVFSDPKATIDELHALNFRVVLHAVILARSLRGTVHDRCDLAKYDEEEAGCYWNTHRKVQALGVDGWWPDEGDPLDAQSRLARNRMYYEGPQLDRTNQRPYALHRNGHAGMQRYAAFLWSGDVFSTWETLRTHVSVAINTGLSGIPYWGTDVGGFVPTKEYTGELHVRWFQFGSFCPLFRAHGRTWHLRLPWGWNTGELGPNEIANYTGGAANPELTELHNAQVEPICRKYLELRYRLMPYLYTAVREGHETGLPIMRALWLHYPNDPSAVARGDQYLWGRDILVAPVVESGARSRRLYLPRSEWYDFWTDEKLEGGREIERPVDLSTTPLFVRSGAIIPFGPVKQYTGERTDEPLSFTIYPGANGLGTLYEDDGATFNYRSGVFMKLQTKWDDARRQFTLRLEEGTRMLPPARRRIDVRLVPQKTARSIMFEGRPIQVQF